MRHQDTTETGYVVAVSGGVDSVVLLDMLANQAGQDGVRPRLTVAHFDHGIRVDSASDREFVAGLAQRYGLHFEYGEGHLGAGASEAVAREARYDFLHSVRESAGAQQIVTAHHEDDVLETAIINLMRGTGRKGLSSLRSTDTIYRPLLRTPKAEILAYARQHGLEWREDSTNSDTVYLRNHVRLNLLPRLDAGARDRLRQLVLEAYDRNAEIDGILDGLLDVQPAADKLDRRWFATLPPAIAREVVAAWLRRHGAAGFDRRTLERLVAGLNGLSPGKRLDVNGRWLIEVRRDVATMLPRG